MRFLQGLTVASRAIGAGISCPRGLVPWVSLSYAHQRSSRQETQRGSCRFRKDLAADVGDAIDSGRSLENRKELRQEH